MFTKKYVLEVVAWENKPRTQIYRSPENHVCRDEGRTWSQACLEGTITHQLASTASHKIRSESHFFPLSLFFCVVISVMAGLWKWTAVAHLPSTWVRLKNIQSPTKQQQRKWQEWEEFLIIGLFILMTDQTDQKLSTALKREQIEEARLQ